MTSYIEEKVSKIKPWLKEHNQDYLIELIVGFCQTNIEIIDDLEMKMISEADSPQYLLGEISLAAEKIAEHNKTWENKENEVYITKRGRRRVIEPLNPTPYYTKFISLIKRANSMGLAEELYAPLETIFTSLVQFTAEDPKDLYLAADPCFEAASSIFFTSKSNEDKKLLLVLKLLIHCPSYLVLQR